MAGVTGRAAASELDNLPAELRTPTPATRSKVLMGNGDLLARFYDENRVPVPLNKIAPVMRQAQIAIEDHRFYEHGALDFKGTLRALIRNSTSDDVQGGSSITQQYVKMVQIQACTAKGDAECVKEAQETTLERKIRELRYAIALEKKFTKDEILTRYLNIAYYGKGAYGVEAAALYYYGVKASQLNLTQAAMLAGLVQNPDTVNPVRNPSAALDRRDVVLNRMTELKLITPQEAQKAKKVGFDPKKVRPTRNGCVGTRYPFLCDYVYKSLLKTPSLGKTVEDRENMVKRGGLTIQTQIDPKSMDLAQKNVSDVVGPQGPDHLDHEHDPAGHRPDRRHGAEPAGDGRQQEEGRDLLEPVRGAGDGRHPGLPGRVDLQAVHARGGPGEGHPDQQEVQRALADGVRRQVLPDLHGPREGVRPVHGAQRVVGHSTTSP